MEEKNNGNALYCSHCGALIGENEDYEEVQGEVVCMDCVERHTVRCDSCSELIFESDSISDEYTTLCEHCTENYYRRCRECNCLVHDDAVYWENDEPYCSDCYHDIQHSIHEYNYKPEPIFFGDSDRYFGVELEIDGAGKDDDNAETLLAIANADKEHIYCKADGSLDEGIELVSFPMSLNYHKQFCWEEIMRKAIALGYRSHQTSTCGLHCHVNRSCFGDTREEQDLVISRILFFVEKHWAELLKFSRRSEYSINRWAARYGYERTGRDILEKAKKGNLGRYAAVNLQNYATIEFRLFRGTLKYNTLIAALELLDKICDVALDYSDEEIEKQSWSEFVGTITEPELITYLKERKLYVNEDIESEVEM